MSKMSNSKPPRRGDEGAIDPYNSSREGTGTIAPRERGPLEVFRKSHEPSEGRRQREREKRIKFEIEGEQPNAEGMGIDPYNSSSTGARTSTHKR